MRRISFTTPRRLVIGKGCFQQFIEDLTESGLKRIFILGIPVHRSLLSERLAVLAGRGIETEFCFGIEKEPSFRDLENVLEKVRDFDADAVAGIGGGSVLDTAKMLAAMLNSRQEISEVKGKDLLRGRDCHLACLPTTSGTGSEVSPNAIFYDDADGSKQGIISPFLVPDASYIDPEMTVGLPPKETAATGMDALTHCIEAYANRNAHPVVDGIALQGIRRIGSGLIPAFRNGDDLVARTEMSIGSMCGGMCLGPVNTAAVHALAYPLGSIHGVAHGLANALLLPHVLRFNLDAAIGRYRDIALALGAEADNNARTTALEGIRIIEEMVRACSLPDRLSGVGIGEPDIGEMVKSAMQVQRLLVNNPKELTAEDARKIYTTAL